MARSSLPNSRLHAPTALRPAPLLLLLSGAIPSSPLPLSDWLASSVKRDDRWTPRLLLLRLVSKDIFFWFLSIRWKSDAWHEEYNIEIVIFRKRSRVKVQMFNLHESCDMKLPTFDMCIHIRISKYGYRRYNTPRNAFYFSIRLIFFGPLLLSLNKSNG